MLWPSGVAAPDVCLRIEHFLMRVLLHGSPLALERMWPAFAVLYRRRALFAHGREPIWMIGCSQRGVWTRPL